MMPGLTGTDLLKAIRQVPAIASIPAIFYSATTDGADEARRLGALDWLVKGQTEFRDLRKRIVDVYTALESGGEADALAVAGPDTPD